MKSLGKKRRGTFVAGPKISKEFDPGVDRLPPRI
jgi:hypothetical protein